MKLEFSLHISDCESEKKKKSNTKIVRRKNHVHTGVHPNNFYFYKPITDDFRKKKIKVNSTKMFSKVPNFG